MKQSHEVNTSHLLFASLSICPSFSVILFPPLDPLKKKENVAALSSMSDPGISSPSGQGRSWIKLLAVHQSICLLKWQVGFQFFEVYFWRYPKGSFSSIISVFLSFDVFGCIRAKYNEIRLCRSHVMRCLSYIRLFNSEIVALSKLS